MAQAHFTKIFKQKRRTLDIFDRKTLRDNSKKVCLSGNWKGRWTIVCLLKEFGFEVEQKPKVGFAAVLAGSQHNRRKSLWGYQKIKRALKYKVPI